MPFTSKDDTSTVSKTFVEQGNFIFSEPLPCIRFSTVIDPTEKEGKIGKGDNPIVETANKALLSYKIFLSGNTLKLKYIAFRVTHLLQ